MATIANSYQSLTHESGLPAYILDYFDTAGVLDVSHYDDGNAETDEAVLHQATQIASLRSIGFTLGQILTLLKTGAFDTAKNSPALASA